MMTQTLEDVLVRWPELHSISDERKRCIKLMLSREWKLEKVETRGQKHYRFTRPDTGGLYDVLEVTHARLKIEDILRKLEAYEPDLSYELTRTRLAWLDKVETETCKTLV